MISGTNDDMRRAVKRLYHFRDAFKADGPFTSLTPFGRNLALLADYGVYEQAAEDSVDELVADLAVCAGAGRILANRCDSVLVSEAIETQADIAAWWWRANRVADMRVFYGVAH